MLNYWLGIFISDIVKYLIFIIIIYPALLTTSIKFLYLLVIFFAFIFASSIFTYAFSFLFTDDKDGQKLYLLFNYLTAFLLVIAEVLLSEDFMKPEYSFGITALFPCSNLFVGSLKFWIFDQQLDNSSAIKILCKKVLKLT